MTPNLSKISAASAANLSWSLLAGHVKFELLLG